MRSSAESITQFPGARLEFSEVRSINPEITSGYRLERFRKVGSALGKEIPENPRDERDLLVDVSASLFLGTSYALKKGGVAEIVAGLGFFRGCKWRQVFFDHVFGHPGEVSASAEGAQQGIGDSAGNPVS
jgi:hypothetical protein